jgi:hypothetical protein
MARRTIIAISILALATMCSPAFAYSNVSPKPALQKVTSIQKSMRSLSTFEFWTNKSGKDRSHSEPKSGE